MSRRKSVRVSVYKPINLSNPAGNVLAKTINISNEGMFVRSQKEFVLGDQLSLELKDQSQEHSISLEALCDVVRVYKNKNADVFLLGLQFVNKFMTKVPKKQFRQPSRQGQKLCI
ncbi:MAG: PilZ domain-containing protein [Methylococcales bacterium]|nr:PilZ domain-containing protein [Methylococcales bacterium]MBT7445964.1 PilZ domain-containing protein [Methylococcales bacterium]